MNSIQTFGSCDILAQANAANKMLKMLIMLNFAQFFSKYRSVSKVTKVQISASFLVRKRYSYQR